jgi:protein TIF31
MSIIEKESKKEIPLP